jgi:hypothetical protein
LKKVVLLTVSLLLHLSVDAATPVDRIDTESYTELRYSWPDKGITFQLSNQNLQKFRGLRRYSPELAKLHVRNQLVLKSAELQQQGLRIRLSPANLPLDIQIKGKDQNAVDKAMQLLAQTQQQAYDNYLANGFFYLLQLPNRQAVVIPDHVKFLKLSVDELKPVAKAFTDQYGRNNIRQIANKLALWIQRIPYQDLSDRQESAGAGYSPPLQLLYDNRGDCDSKAVLFAGVMKNIFPNSQFRIIYFRDHAVIAAQIPAVKNEQGIEIDGIKFLLIDATGPLELPIGQLTEQYQQAIDNRQFTHRLL